MFLACGKLDVDCTVLSSTPYEGPVSKTKSGLECQAWLSQTPHTHTMAVTWTHNYCRNPSSQYPGLWCYTMDQAVKTEYCAECEDCEEGEELGYITV